MEQFNPRSEKTRSNFRSAIQGTNENINSDRDMVKSNSSQCETEESAASGPIAGTSTSQTTQSKRVNAKKAVPENGVKKMRRAWFRSSKKEPFSVIELSDDDSEIRLITPKHDEL